VLGPPGAQHAEGIVTTEKRSGNGGVLIVDDDGAIRKAAT
jgi:hypothetical protein